MERINNDGFNTIVDRDAVVLADSMARGGAVKKTLYHGSPYPSLKSLTHGIGVRSGVLTGRNKPVGAKAASFFAHNRSEYLWSQGKGAQPAVYQAQVKLGKVADFTNADSAEQIVQAAGIDAEAELVGTISHFHSSISDMIEEGRIEISDMWRLADSEDAVSKLKKAGFDTLKFMEPGGRGISYAVLNPENISDLRQIIDNHNKGGVSGRVIAYHIAPSKLDDVIANQVLSDVQSTAKALEGVDVSLIESLLPQVIDEESYLLKNGAPFMGGAEPALHKNIQAGRGKNQALKRVQDNMRENNQRREELRKEYQEKVARGEIRQPNRIEKLIAAANGHEDLEATRAARRLLEKREVDWTNIKTQNEIISEAYHKAKSDGSNPELVQAVESLLGATQNKLEEGGYLHGSKYDFCDTGFKLGKATGYGQNLWGTGIYLTRDADLAKFYAKYLLTDEEKNQLRQKVADTLGFKIYDDIPHDYKNKKYDVEWSTKYLKYALFEKYAKEIAEQRGAGNIYEVTLFKGKERGKDYHIIDFTGDDQFGTEKADLKKIIDTASKPKWKKILKRQVEELGYEFSEEEFTKRFIDDFLKGAKTIYADYEGFRKRGYPVMANIWFEHKLRPNYNYYANSKEVNDKLTDAQMSEVRRLARKFEEENLREFFTDAGYDALIYTREYDLERMGKDGEHPAKAIVVFNPDDITIEKCNGVPQRLKGIQEKARALKERLAQKAAAMDAGGVPDAPLDNEHLSEIQGIQMWLKAGKLKCDRVFTFGKGIRGKNENRYLIAYLHVRKPDMVYSKYEGAMVEGCTSDFDRAEPCKSCGRLVVHQFYVYDTTDKSIKLYGSEHVNEVLGFPKVTKIDKLLDEMMRKAAHEMEVAEQQIESVSHASRGVFKLDDANVIVNRSFSNMNNIPIPPTSIWANANGELYRMKDSFVGYIKAAEEELGFVKVMDSDTNQLVEILPNGKPFDSIYEAPELLDKQFSRHTLKNGWSRATFKQVSAADFKYDKPLGDYRISDAYKGRDNQEIQQELRSVATVVKEDTKKEAGGTVGMRFDAGGTYRDSNRNINFTNKISQNEIRNVISGFNQVVNSTIIYAAKAHIGAGDGAGEMAESTQQVKQQEAEELRQFAIHNKLWLSELDFGTFITEGAEQKVYYSENRGFVLKKNTAIFYLSWVDFFNSLLLHNYFFPQTAYQLIGFSEESGALIAVIKQDYIKANMPTDLTAVEKFMNDNGFYKKKNQDYENKELGLILEDLHEENVLTKDGLLYFVDTVFYLKNNTPNKFKKGGHMDLLAPNGKPTNLTHQQWHLVRTPEFKEWFGDWEKAPDSASKVIDENGEPLVVYHGAKGDFTVFDTELNNRGSDFGAGSYFTTSRAMAKVYGKPKVCFLSLKDPMILASRYDINRVWDNLIDYKEETKQESLTLKQYLVGKGADGIIINQPIAGVDDSKEIWFVAYHPEQIKLADGTNTTFDANNTDIRFAKGGIPERYRNMGFTRVGEKKKSTKPEKKWMVLARKGDQYRVVHGGYKGMQDYTQHRDEKRRERFWQRMGGKDSAQANDPFSPLYWHKKFGTWEDGGEINGDTVACKNCGWSWSIHDSSPSDKYICHQCRQDNTPDAGFAKGGSILLAPNGKPSNLTPEQYKLVRTPAFKAWFGDWEKNPANASEVVDKNGEPLVVYHGTREMFTIFDQSKVVDWFHFGTLAQATMRSSKYIIPVFLNARRLKREKDSGGWITKGNRAIKNNYDGIVYLNRYEGFRVLDYGLSQARDSGMLDSMSDRIFKKRVPVAEDSYIVFEPEQIKLADGTNTQFKGNNPDIRFKQGGSTLLAPNGKPSNLTPAQYKLVRSPEFKQWFGDWELDKKNASKALDANGEPLVLYHGMKDDLIGGEFRKKRSRTMGGKMLGNKALVFTDDRLLAAQYAGIKKSPLHEGSTEYMKERDGWWSYPEDAVYGGNVVPVFLRMLNPLIQDAQDGMYYDVEPKIVRKALAKGYDGAIIKNVWDKPGTSGSVEIIKHNEYVVFDSRNIKSAYANKTFDLAEADITMKQGGKADINEIQLLINRWHGKIVEKNKTISPLYHGTCHEFERFDLHAGTPKDTISALGFHFSPSRDIAVKYFANESAPCYVFEVGARATKTLRIRERDLTLLLLDYAGVAMSSEGEDISFYEHAGIDHIRDAFFDDIISEKGNAAATYFRQSLLDMGVNTIEYLNELETDVNPRYDWIVLNEKDIVYKKKMNVEELPSVYKKGGDVSAEINAELNSIIASAKQNNTYLLAPNGQPTKLTPQQWAMVRTQRFKQWFGDWMQEPEWASKMVDENGEPRVLYHGTRHDFDAFKKRRNDIGIHFGTLGQAEDRVEYKVLKTGQTSQESVLPVFLYIRNPLRMSDVGWWDVENVSYELQKVLNAKEEIDECRDIEAMKQLIRSYGYDGIVYKNTGETQGGVEYVKRMDEAFEKLRQKYNITNVISPEIQKTPEYKEYKRLSDEEEQHRMRNAEDSYIVFEPEQIKSAIANRGTFSNRAKNILLDAGGVACRYESDKIRLEHVRDALKKPIDHSEIKLMDIWHADDLTLVQNQGDVLIYKEWFVKACWDGMFQKPEYKGLTKKEGLKKLMEERFPWIAEQVGGVVESWKFSNPVLTVRIKLNKKEMGGISTAVPMFDTKAVTIEKREQLKEGAALKLKRGFQSEANTLVRAKKRLLSPTGRVSKLSALQYALVRTPEFKKWFGDWEAAYKDYVGKKVSTEVEALQRYNCSHALDENFEPKVFWHGTEAKKYPNKLDPAMGDDRLIFFTDDEATAKSYGSTKPLFLNIKKPYVFNAGGRAFNDIADRINSIYTKVAFHEFGTDGDGIDSVMIRHVIDDASGGLLWGRYEPSTVVGILEPSQAKLADGTNTTFNPKTQDIRREAGGAAGSEEIYRGVRIYDIKASTGFAKAEVFLLKSKFVNNEWKIMPEKITLHDKLENVKKEIYKLEKMGHPVADGVIKNQ